MSHLSFFSDIFHNLGGLSIELDKALNTLVRSYRTPVSADDKDAANERLLSFLLLFSGEGEKASVPKVQQLWKELEEFITHQNISMKIGPISEKIKSGKKLTKHEIDILDDLINQVSHQATVAFRRIMEVTK